MELVKMNKEKILYDLKGCGLEKYMLKKTEYDYNETVVYTFIVYVSSLDANDNLVIHVPDYRAIIIINTINYIIAELEDILQTMYEEDGAEKIEYKYSVDGEPTDCYETAVNLEDEIADCQKAISNLQEIKDFLET